MHKRYFKWFVIGGSLSFGAAILLFQPSARAWFAPEFWQNMARYSRVMRLVETEYVHADEVSYKGVDGCGPARSGAVVGCCIRIT